MTAPIVYHDGRQLRTILRDGPENSGDTLTKAWCVPGQLWSRLAEGKVNADLAHKFYKRRHMLGGSHG